MESSFHAMVQDLLRDPVLVARLFDLRHSAVHSHSVLLYQLGVSGIDRKREGRLMDERGQGLVGGILGANLCLPSGRLPEVLRPAVTPA